MRLQISEMAKLCGVSVRTLHYYDQIGLLRPETAVDSGYRWYGAAEVERMQQILFFRELDFSLKEITAILADPHYDRHQALRDQKELLTRKRDRLNDLLDLLDRELKGEHTMSFQEFDKDYIDRYAAEVKERWGSTQAYQESQERTARYNKADFAAQNEAMTAIFERFGALRQKDPGDPEVQSLVVEWRQFITDHYYTCTKEILAGLGQMYIADERFRKTLDHHGAGTADFMSQAIAIYCK
jgi:DNA-binding transcriptional MerR regulator